jgi:endonuclease-3
MKPVPQGRSDAGLRERVQETERILRSVLGNPAFDVHKQSALDILIATILSQNTNDVNSHKAWLNLKKTFKNWDEVLGAPARRVAKAIEVGGLKNQKARAIRSILRRLKKKSGRYSLAYLGKMSDEAALAHLQEFPGVGSKTAACVLMFSLKREVFPVDTHIHRILNRLGIVRTTSPDKTFAEMTRLLPPGKAYPFHLNLIRFGRETCGARHPRCGDCPLYDLCVFPLREQYTMERFTKRGGAEARDFIILHHLKRRAGKRSVDSPRKKP